MAPVGRKSDSARKAAEAAAQKALQDKVALVGVIGEAQAAVEELGEEKVDLERRHEEERDALEGKITDAEQRVRGAYDTAVAGGWTTRDLADMGINSPRKKRKQRRSPASTTQQDEATPHPANPQPTPEPELQPAHQY